MHRADFFSKVLDVYLQGSGVKRRVVNTLAGLGVCNSYKAGRNLMKQIAERAEVRGHYTLLY